jgi:hypothetical protein
MSEEVKDNKDSETRVKINTKDAAAAMLPAGVDVEKLTPEQQLNVTSTMVKASRLHEKAIEGLTLEEQDVFNALLLATPDDMDVEKRFAQAQDLFTKTVKKPEQKQEETVEEKEATKISPKGEMDVTTPVTVKDSNLLTETNDAPFGDDDAYFKFLEDRYKKQTTVKRQKEIIN